MKTDEIASKFLGKKVDSYTEYNPSLLVAVPRSENRKQYNIQNDNLPFTGCDIWHAYEFSAITDNGVPVTRLIKIKYNCNNEFLVESKSLKLYLNSFNMSRFGKTTGECLDICKNIIEKDLSNVLKTQVTINFLNNNTERVDIFKNFRNIMDFTDETNLKVEKFKEAPELLKTEETDAVQEYRLKFDSLRSNCRVTHQPDFGDAFIYYKSSRHILEKSLVQYLSSFRSEFHFHEECCEMIYKRLQDILNKDDELCVCALYTRRGGIDINPIRTNCGLDDIEKLANPEIFARGSIKQ